MNIMLMQFNLAMTDLERDPGDGVDSSMKMSTCMKLLLGLLGKELKIKLPI